MIVRQLNVVSVRVCPSKANPVLAVHANTELAISIAAKGFQAISWRNSDIIQALGAIQKPEPAERDARYRCPPPWRFPMEELFRLPIPERSNHLPYYSTGITEIAIGGYRC